jgi:hypothetical protein
VQTRPDARRDRAVGRPTRLGIEVGFRTAVHVLGSLK